ncbi:hypothetical protein [Bacillus sp. OK048]|uniref:hypothetical protein n=1 Tax=Bacillus sp. OK048 TaxID=1882761 RepID=UPI00087F630B|nr:hypothetical protein [Bacillus sp. OK048]SDM15917.1 hypothetical protein SAMN05443253_102108 [Bacillus sp. OK048]
MSNETVNEWLRNKGLSNTDIDFIETLLTFTSTAKRLSSKLDEINQRFQSLFPDKKAEINPNLTFWKFEKLLQGNVLFIDLNEMLNRYKAQGLCVDLCNQLLESQLKK